MNPTETIKVIEDLCEALEGNGGLEAKPGAEHIVARDVAAYNAGRAHVAALRAELAGEKPTVPPVQGEGWIFWQHYELGSQYATRGDVCFWRKYASRKWRICGRKTSEYNMDGYRRVPMARVDIPTDPAAAEAIADLKRQLEVMK